MMLIHSASSQIPTRANTIGRHINVSLITQRLTVASHSGAILKRVIPISAFVVQPWSAVRNRSRSLSHETTEALRASMARIEQLQILEISGIRFSWTTSAGDERCGHP